MDKKKLSTPQITKIALMVAFVSAASYLRIPLPFSEAAITGQTLAVNLVALTLSPLEAFITLLCYWLLGLVGAPVYGGASGPGKMFGPAGGYFIGFIVAVVLIAWLRGKKYCCGSDCKANSGCVLCNGRQYGTWRQEESGRSII